MKGGEGGVRGKGRKEEGGKGKEEEVTKGCDLLRCSLSWLTGNTCKKGCFPGPLRSVILAGSRNLFYGFIFQCNINLCIHSLHFSISTNVP